MERAFGAHDTDNLRHRDSGEHERVQISELLGKLLPLVS
jgi:hypothetical protein